MPTIELHPPASGAVGNRVTGMTFLYNGSNVAADMDMRAGSYCRLANHEGRLCYEFVKVSGSNRSESSYYHGSYFPNVGEHWCGFEIRLNEVVSSWDYTGQEHEGNDSPAVGIDVRSGVLTADLRGGPTPFIGASPSSGGQHTKTAGKTLPSRTWVRVMYHVKSNPAGGDTLFEMWFQTLDKNPLDLAAWTLVDRKTGIKIGYASGTPGRYWKIEGGIYTGNTSTQQTRSVYRTVIGPLTRTHLNAAMKWTGSTPPPPPPPPVDTTKPTVKLVTPVNGSELELGVLTILAEASDNTAVDHVDIFLDGVKIATEANPPYTFQTPLTEGNHSVDVTAYDKAGNFNGAKADFSVVGAPPPPPADTDKISQKLMDEIVVVLDDHLSQIGGRVNTLTGDEYTGRMKEAGLDTLADKFVSSIDDLEGNAGIHVAAIKDLLDKAEKI